MVGEWISQLAKASWCQRESWEPCIWRMSLFCRSGV